MADITLGELAVRYGLTLRGDPARRVDHVATLSGAGPGSVAFLANPKLADSLAGCRAGVVILTPALEADCPVDCLVGRNPHAAFARIAAELYPAMPVAPGVHPSAVIEEGAVVDATAHIGAQCFIGAGARIGARVQLGPGCIVAAGAELAEDVRLVARVTVLEIGRASCRERVSSPV